MKKFLAITLTIVMLISVVACDSSSDKESNTESTKKALQTTESKQTTQTTQEETTTEKQTTQTTDNGGGNGGGGNNSGSGAGAGPVYGASVSQKDREIHGKYWETIQAIKNAASFHLDVINLESIMLSYQYDSDEVGNEYVYRSPDITEPLVQGYKVGNSYYDGNGNQDIKVATVYDEIQAAITACTTVDQYNKMTNFNGSHEEGGDYSIYFKNGGKTYICTISDDGTIFELNIIQGTNQMSYSFRNISAQKKLNLLPSGF